MTPAELDELVAERNVLTSHAATFETVQKMADALDALRAELAAKEVEIADVAAKRDLLWSLLRDLCGEWNEQCEPCCDSFGHSDECQATNLAAAKRAMRERAERAEAAAAALRALLPLLASAWFYGGWKAETTNEREMQAIMERAGWWPWKDESALLAALDADTARALEKK